MGKVLQFLTREERRIKKHLPEMELYILQAMDDMLPKGFQYYYYRFGPPTMDILPKHHWLIKEELERRHDSQNPQVSQF